MMNKKGQSMEQLLLLGLGLAVVVVVLVGFIFGWGTLLSPFKSVPKLEVASQVCQQSVEREAYAAYCEFTEVEIAGKDQYINCEYPDIQAALAKANLEVTGFGCGTLVAKSECERLKVGLAGKFKNDILVNGVTCESVGVTKSVA